MVPRRYDTVLMALLSRYEFRQYETAMSVAKVSLETKSTLSGQGDFVAVGTIISRGEDLASKGAVSAPAECRPSLSAVN